jgi:hypothetical protein
MKTIRLYITGGVCLIITLLSANVYAQNKTDNIGSFSGRVYSDYYWVAQNNNSDLEGENGFWFRRIYLTYNKTLNSQFSTRLRLEMNSDGSFGNQGVKMTPVVKDAYLKWKKEDHQILAGISGTPAFGVVEDVWGYRSVEKTPLDLYGMASTRDFGLSAKGSLLDEGNLKYHFMLGNGNNNRANEINQGKKWMLSLGYNLTESILVEIYGDYDDRSGLNDTYILQAFAAYQSENFNLGILLAQQTYKNALPDGDLNTTLGSLFGHFVITDKTRGFLRLDHAFDGVPGTEDNDYLPIVSSVSSTLIIAGVDYSLSDNIKLQPNIEAVLYGENDPGNAPGTDLIPRMTLFYKF